MHVKGGATCNFSAWVVHYRCRLCKPLQVLALKTKFWCLHKPVLCEKKAYPDSKILIHVGQTAAAFCFSDIKVGNEQMQGFGYCDALSLVHHNSHNCSEKIPLQLCTAAIAAQHDQHLSLV